MPGLIIEQGSFGANPGTKDIARHLYSRMYEGKVVIIAAKPLGMLSSLRKQWLRLLRKVHVERARTLDGRRILELSNIAGYMQKLEFTLDYPPDEYLGDVYITTPEDALRWPPVCRTIYITCDVELEKRHMITAWMPMGSLVVICRLQ
jgi:hypothetical protein